MIFLIRIINISFEFILQQFFTNKNLNRRNQAKQLDIPVMAVLLCFQKHNFSSFIDTCLFLNKLIGRFANQLDKIRCLYVEY